MTRHIEDIFKTKSIQKYAAMSVNYHYKNQHTEWWFTIIYCCQELLSKVTYVTQNLSGKICFVGLSMRMFVRNGHFQDEWLGHHCCQWGNGCRLWMIVGQASNLPSWCLITFLWLHCGLWTTLMANNKKFRSLGLVGPILLSCNYFLALHVNLPVKLPHTRKYIPPEILLKLML